MKNLKIILFVAAFFVTHIGSITFAQDLGPDCNTLSTGSDLPVGGMECKTTPTSLIFTIYELSLCTAAATPSNQMVGATNPCTKLHYDVNGEAIDLSADGTSIQLVSDVSLAEGTYTHALLKMNTEFLMTTKLEFAASRTANNTTSGAFCYSNGSDIDIYPASNTSHITCGNSFPTTVEPSNSSLQLLGEEAVDFDMNQEIALSTTLDGVTSVTDLYILDSDGTQSSGDLTYAGSAPNLIPVVSGGSDRTYIMASQILTTPVEISPNTTNVELAILVKDASGLFFDPSNGNIVENGFNGLIIQISAN